MAVAVDLRLGLERNLDIEYMNYRERLVSVISEETEVLALDRKVGLQVRNSDKANGVMSHCYFYSDLSSLQGSRRVVQVCERINSIKVEFTRLHSRRLYTSRP